MWTGGTITTTDISTAIAYEIDKQLQNLPSDKRVVCLRADRDIQYRHSRYALAGIDKSSATDIKLAVMNQKR